MTSKELLNAQETDTLKCLLGMALSESWSDMKQCDYYDILMSGIEHPVNTLSRDEVLEELYWIFDDSVMDLDDLERYLTLL